VKGGDRWNEPRGHFLKNLRQQSKALVRKRKVRQFTVSKNKLEHTISGEIKEMYWAEGRSRGVSETSCVLRFSGIDERVGSSFWD